MPRRDTGATRSDSLCRVIAEPASQIGAVGLQRVIISRVVETGIDIERLPGAGVENAVDEPAAQEAIGESALQLAVPWELIPPVNDQRVTLVKRGEAPIAAQIRAVQRRRRDAV